MYIEPNTDIYLLSEIPLDNTYRNSIYFSSATAQANYFSSKANSLLRFTSQTYQRKGRGYIRLQCDTAQKMRLAYGCNYLMYKNTSFENKWFYAFITSVEYINNAVLEIQYEIDVLQTWHFDYELQECFIERETVRNDAVGAHTLAENIDIGGFYQFSHINNMTNWNSYSCVVISSYQDTVGEHSVDGQYIAGIYSGSDYTVAVMDNPEQRDAFNDYLSAIVNANQLNSIVGILFCPTAITPSTTDGEWNTEPYRGYLQARKRQDSLGSYTPRNKKLLTFPFNALYVHNSLGDSKIYRYEQFGNTHDNASGYCEFYLMSEFSGSPEVDIYPNNYMREGIDFDNGLSISNFPQCSFSYDVYRAWIANGGAVKATANIVGSAIGMVGSFNPASVVPASSVGGATVSNPEQIPAGVNDIGMASGALGIANTVADVAIKSIQPSAQVGTQQSTVMTSNRYLGFYCAQAHIRPEIATVIDDYFDVYGYQVNYKRVPTRNNRPHWTYIKTRNCDAIGSVPVNDMRKIQSIYDNGVTWWMDGNEVGNYSLDNSPS